MNIKWACQSHLRVPIVLEPDFMRKKLAEAKSAHMRLWKAFKTQQRINDYINNRMVKGKTVRLSQSRQYGPGLNCVHFFLCKYTLGMKTINSIQSEFWWDQ